MGNLKFLRSKATELPEEVQDGNVYFQKQIKALTADIGTERYRLNPPTDWNETLKDSPSYIENKPELGTVASHDVAEEIAQTNQIPTAKLVYNTNRELERKLETAKSAAVGPLVAEAIAEMTDLTRPYVYVGEESGMNVNHWYWYDGETWQDGGVYNSQGVDTDKTLLVQNKAADAATVGNLINNLQGDTEDLYIKVDKLIEFQEAQEILNETFADDMEVTDGGYAYLLNNGNRIGGPYGPFAGNGGGYGGGGSYDSIDAKFSAQNTTEWASATISDGDDIYFTFTWESIENDVPNGRGTLTVTVNNVAQPSVSVPQGDNRINLKNYYKPGANKIRIRIADQYDQGKSWIVNVNAVSLTIASVFSTSFPFEDVITFPYTPTGNVSKTIHFIIDKGTEHEVEYTNVTSVSGKQLSQTFPAQSHGSHTLDVYFNAEINGEPVKSNTLHYEFISIDANGTDTIIVSPFTATEQQQYSSVVIPYSVYDPAGVETQVKIYVNDVLSSTETVDRSQHSFTYKANHPGTANIKFVCGNTEKVITLTVTASEVRIEAETEALALYLTAQGHSNNGEDRDVWEYGDIAAQFTNFGYKLDGWMNDSDGSTVLRTMGDARVYIPYKPFARNFYNTGKTFEIEFSTHDVVDYSAPIISCMHDGIGFEITPQTVTFKSAQTELMYPFKDNEHIRVTIVVHKQVNNRLVLFYVNGVMSSALQYPNGENFGQGTGAVGISIGSNLCGVDIYNMRIYDNDLNREQVINNWIADTPNGSLMLERFNRNNIFDNGTINPNTLPSNLPYWIINAPELPQYKGDKKTVTLSFTDPASPQKSFTAEGVQINVQGTSSQAYFRKNYDLQFKKGFNLRTGYSDNYVIIDAVPFNRFVLKADVASSESTNNTRLTMFYNDTCPYKTTEMTQNLKVRWGIEGRPCVLFWNNTDTGTLEFLGKCNFNLPKRAPGPYGYSGNDESWEVERNNSANVQFQDNDFVTEIFDDDEQTWKPEWYDDWEARFPEDTWRDIHKLNEFVSWVKSTWRDEATNANLAEPVTYRLNTLVTLTNYGSDTSYTVVDELENGQKTGYSNITFTKDTPAYRLTKFRAEAPQYMEIESATYYYLFTLFFLMIDSRAKNMFFGFHGGPTDLQYIERKTVFEPYDMDTAIGTNNSGVLKFGYYHLDTDTVSSIISGGDDGDSGKEAPVFNGQGSVLWSNFRDAFRSEYAAMYKNLRANGTWTYNRIEKIYEDHQAMWPEALFNEDAYVKYLIPLIENVTWDEDTGKYIKTDRYLTMLQGSKEQQRKWWLQNRFRYFDSMFTVGSADTSFIEMRLFNSGTLTVTPSQDLYVAARFGRGSTTQRVRATANTPVSFPYTVREGMTVTEMESTIFSADLISDVGDLSVFYGNEFDFSRATKLRKLKLGDASPTYSNKNLKVLNVSNCYLLEEIDCRNCDELTQPINLDGSPMLEKAYFDGTKITSVSLVDGAPITTLHLPATITSLVLMNHNKLTDLTCPSYANVSTLMIANIDQSVIDPLALLPIIKKGSRVNIQGIDITIEIDPNDVVVTVPVYDENDNQTGTEQRTLTTDEEKAGYQIEQFLDSLDEMTGVERVWATHVDGDGNTTEGWDYNDQDTAVVSGTIRTERLTGAQIASYNQRYPYLKIEAEYYTSNITFKTWDGESTLSIVECRNGIMQASAPTIPARTSTAQYDYTPVGWSRNQDAQTAQGDALTQIVADRVVYAAYSRTIRTYTVTWKNSNGTTLETDTNVPYGSTPVYNGATPKDSNGYASTGWDKDIEPVTGNVTYTAIYKPVYTATFKLASQDGGTTLQARSIQEGNTASYTGATPTTSRGDSTMFTFIGWTPAFAPMYANVTYTAVFRDNRSVVIKYLVNSLEEFESDSLTTFGKYAFSGRALVSAKAPVTKVEGYAFSSCTNLKTVDLTATSGAVTIENHAFDECINLTSLIIRSDTMATLGGAITYGNIVSFYGAVYVPETLVNTYKADANWGKYIILPISEYPANYLDGSTLYNKSWDDIIGDANYATNYAIGDTKSLNFGEYGDHLMQLVAKDSDDKTSGGKARMTWICKDIITTHRMNASNTTVGGWESTEMRSWLNDTVLPTLPENIRNAIVEVNKVSSTYDSKIIVNGQITADKLWIPSNHEVGFGTSYESTGSVYSVFNSNSARIKHRNGSAYYWWLRSASSSTFFRYVSSGGSALYNYASVAYGVVPGFCI